MPHSAKLAGKKVDLKDTGYSSGRAWGKGTHKKKFKLTKLPRHGSEDDGSKDGRIEESPSEDDANHEGEDDGSKDGRSEEGHNEDDANDDAEPDDGPSPLQAAPPESGVLDIPDGEHAAVAGHPLLEVQSTNSSQSLGTLPALGSDDVRGVEDILSTLFDDVRNQHKDNQAASLPKNSAQFSRYVAERLAKFPSDILKPLFDKLSVDTELALVLQGEAGDPAGKMKATLGKFIKVIEQCFQCEKFETFLRFDEGLAQSEWQVRALSESLVLFAADFEKPLQKKINEAKKSEWKRLKPALPQLIEEGISSASEQLCQLLFELAKEALKAAEPEKIAGLAWSR